MTTTATFIDTYTYTGARKIVLAAFRTQRAGARVIRYRWEGAVTGFTAAGFATEAAAIAAASRHALIRDIITTEPAR